MPNAFPIKKRSTLIPFSPGSRGLPFFVFPFPHGSLPQGIKQEHPPFSVHGLGQLWLAHQRMSKNFIRTSRIRSILKDSPAFPSIYKHQGGENTDHYKSKRQTDRSADTKFASYPHITLPFYYDAFHPSASFCRFFYSLLPYDTSRKRRNYVAKMVHVFARCRACFRIGRLQRKK